MTVKTIRFSSIAVIFTTILSLAVLEFGGAGGCGGGAGTTRNMSGTVSEGSLSGLTIRSGSQAGLVLKNQALGCSDIQFCCFGYNGNASVVDVGDDCSFDIDLDLESFCFCAFFSGDDSDGDGCGDDYLAEIGCAEGGYSGAIPIFADDDDSTDSIDLGTITIQGDSAVPESDPCAQVDQDNDGTDDFEDTDDDGDEELDEEDLVCGGGCDNAAEFDSDGDDIPDIFQDTWDSQDDSDGDDIPDFCDVTEDCDPTEADTDGDCIEDSFSELIEDDDDDGVEAFEDCDDSDPAVTFECYDADLCSLDLDEDGLGLCDDCDDLDPDNNLTIEECESETFACDLGPHAECGSDFECQLFAEDEIVAGTDHCGGGKVNCFSCIDGCCTQ